MSCVPWGNETERADYYKNEYESCRKELKKYEDAEKQGLLVKLPCKVGDMVYVICYGEVVATCVTEFEINPKGIIAKVNADPDIYSEYDIEDIYASEEEAEAALKARENK